MIDDVIAAARECLDVPFRHQGRDPATGLDCAGLICYAAASAGYEYDDVSGYGRTPSNGTLLAAVHGQRCLERVRGAPAAGDILVMRFKTEPQHLALMTDRGIIHSYEAIGRVVEHSLDARWRARIVAAYRFVGPE